MSEPKAYARFADANSAAEHIRAQLNMTILFPASKEVEAYLRIAAYYVDRAIEVKHEKT